MSIRKLAIISSQAFSIVNFRGPLIVELVRRGVTVYALASDYDEGLRRRVAELGAIPVDYRLARAGVNPVRDAVAVWDLTRTLRRIAPDATLGYFVKPVIYGSIAAWLAGVRRRFSLIEGLGFVFADGPDSSGIRRRILRTLVARLYRFALARNHGVIVLNRDDIATLANSGVLDPGKAVLIPGTGVDLEHYRVTPIPLHPLTFLLVARMLREKGVGEFVDAARAIKRDRPETRFVLVGGTDFNPGSVSARQLEAWMKEGVVEWVGQVDDVRPWFARSSVFVLPSYYREGIPRGNQEAMASGRPVITTDWVGCRETVEDGVNGILVPVRDTPALIEAMRRYIDEPALVQQHGLAGRRMAEERFDVRAINRRFLDVLGL